jgi:hypothetical protein
MVATVPLELGLERAFVVIVTGGSGIGAATACRLEPEPEPGSGLVPAIGDEPAPPAGKFADRARRNHALVHGLRAEGSGLREIARHLGWGLHTV